MIGRPPGRWSPLVFLFLSVAGLAFLFSIQDVVRMVVIAMLAAYILDPVVTSLELRGLSRTSATVLFFCVLCVGMGALLAIVLPQLIDQVQALQSGANSPEANAAIARIQLFVRQKFAFLGFQDFDLQQRIHELSLAINHRILHFLLNDVVSLMLEIVTIPFFTFFFLKDGREMKKQVIGVVPNRYFEFAMDLLYKMDVQLGNYLRSQFLDALIFGALSAAALWIIDVKYFLFIGAFAGLANLIPFVGPVAGALPAFFVSVVDTGDIAKGTQVIIAFVILKLLDDIVIQPLLVSKSVNLHPLLVLLAIIVGGQLFGILGMLVAVPCVGFLKVGVTESLVTLRKYRFS